MRYIELKTYQFFNKLYPNRWDYFFDSQLIYLFLNRLNYVNGKSLNHKLYYKLLLLMKLEGYVPVDFFYQVLFYNMINIKTVHIQISGRPHYIPVPALTSEGFSIIIRYLSRGSRFQKADTFEQRLLLEFEGIVYFLCRSYGYDALEKMADQAKEDHIFMHYRWR